MTTEAYPATKTEADLVRERQRDEVLRAYFEWRAYADKQERTTGLRPELFRTLDGPFEGKGDR